jgi:hypothetical protein
MRKLMAAVVGVAALCGMTAFAQTAPSAPPAAPPTTVSPDEHIMRAHREGQMLQHALMEGIHDPALLPLISKALTDRTTLLQSELDHVAKLQALVTAIQSGDKTAIQTAREAAKASLETVVANAKILSEDCKAIREAMPHREHHERHTTPGSGSTPAATGND